MNTEINRMTQESANIPNRLAYEGALTGTVGGLVVAIAGDASAHEAPVVHDVGLGVGIALCVVGVGMVLQHARERWYAR